MQSARGVYFSTAGGWDASCPSCLAQPAQSHHNLVNTRHASIHQKAADWRELWPRDASIWKTRQHPLYSPTRVCLASHAFPSLSHAHTEPILWADWQEVQTVGHHRFHFKRVTGNRQFTDGWLLAGKTCFIYQPAGGSPIFLWIWYGQLWSLFGLI